MSSRIENGERLAAFARRESRLKTFERDGNPHGDTYETPEQQLDWVRDQGVFAYRKLIEGKPVILTTLFGYQPYEVNEEEDARVVTIEQEIDRAARRLAIREYEEELARVFSIDEALDRVGGRLAMSDWALQESLADCGYDSHSVDDGVTPRQILYAFVEGIHVEASAYDDDETMRRAETVLGFEPEEEDIQPPAQSGDRIIIVDQVIMITPMTGILPTITPRKFKFDA